MPGRAGSGPREGVPRTSRVCPPTVGAVRYDAYQQATTLGRSVQGAASVEVETETVERLRVALAVLSRALRQTTSATGLTPTELSVLATVARTGPMRISDLADAERINPTMLSRITGRLCDAGLIRRETDAADRRSARLGPTSAGRALQRRIRAERTASLREHLAELGEADVDAILHSLPALEALAERTRQSPAGARQ